jgi:hypothetical protein
VAEVKRILMMDPLILPKSTVTSILKWLSTHWNLRKRVGSTFNHRCMIRRFILHINYNIVKRSWPLIWMAVWHIYCGKSNSSKTIINIVKKKNTIINPYSLRSLL